MSINALKLERAVIDAARAAMDDSVEAYDSEGSIKISSELAASLSLCLDEYDRAIREALAEQPAQQQEPEYKGWYCAHCQRGVDGSEVTYHEQHTVCGRVITDDLPPKAQQEPVGEITAEDMGRPFNAIRIGTHFYKEVPPVGTKLYTSPPASKPWVGLTDEQRHAYDYLGPDVYDAITKTEAKLREKNA